MARAATATWVLRGDTEGCYDLTASYAGTLEPFGDTVTVHAATDKQLHVWGGSALELTVDADDEANDRYPYHVTVGLKNVADVPVYNPTLQLLTEGKKNYIYQPREQLVVTSRRTGPGRHPRPRLHSGPHHQRHPGPSQVVRQQDRRRRRGSRPRSPADQPPRP